jgi:ubiquinone/menaquinone biosynthesis C-methylase UbiE
MFRVRALRVAAIPLTNCLSAEVRFRGKSGRAAGSSVKGSGIEGGKRVLDIDSGPGLLANEMAASVGRNGRVEVSPIQT